MEKEPEGTPQPRQVTHEEFVRERSRKLLRRGPARAPLSDERIHTARRYHDRESRAESKETQAVVCALLGFFIFPPLMVVAAFIGRRTGRTLALICILLWALIVALLFTARANARAAGIETRVVDPRACGECEGKGYARYENFTRMQCRSCSGTGLRSSSGP
jgi:hypothetical protein